MPHRARRRSSPARCSRRASRAGATSSTRSCTGRRRTCRGASPSTAPTASRRYPCATYPFETTGFHPLFFYESVLDILGGFIVLFVVARYLPRLRPGDLAAFWGIWYGSTRAVLETFRPGWNWTVGGIADGAADRRRAGDHRRHLDRLQPPARLQAVPDYPEPIVTGSQPPPDPFADEREQGLKDGFADDEDADGEDDTDEDEDEAYVEDAEINNEDDDEPSADSSKEPPTAS